MAERREGKEPLERPRRRREDSIKMCLKAMWRTGLDWIDLTQDRDQWLAVVNVVTNLRVP